MVFKLIFDIDKSKLTRSHWIGSPKNWLVHTKTENPVCNVTDLQGKKYEAHMHCNSTRKAIKRIYASNKGLRPSFHMFHLHKVFNHFSSLPKLYKNLSNGFPMGKRKTWITSKHLKMLYNSSKSRMNHSEYSPLIKQLEGPIVNGQRFVPQ